MKVLNHEPEQAEQCAWIIHTKGKCVVKRGSDKDLLKLSVSERAQLGIFLVMQLPPEIEGEKCDLCGSDLTSSDVANTPKAMASAALVSGVGCITSKIPGDFKDLLKSIKKGSPGCNMDKY
jgi:hypothetical protein